MQDTECVKIQTINELIQGGWVGRATYAWDSSYRMSNFVLDKCIKLCHDKELELKLYPALHEVRAYFTINDFNDAYIVRRMTEDEQEKADAFLISLGVKKPPETKEGELNI